MTDEKKSREWIALKLLFDPRAFVVAEGESPDFVLRSPPDGQPFGVEVTDLYESEVEARLDRIPGYAVELIRGSDFRHRSDASELLVDDVEFTSPDGRTVRGRAVGRRVALPFSHFQQALSQLIATKNRKATAYRSDLQFVSLLIVDRTDCLSLARPEQLFPSLFTAELRRSVFETPFAEVHFITTIENGRRVHLPLRTLLLVSYVFQFPSALAAFTSTTARASVHPLAELHSYLAGKGLDANLVGGEAGPTLLLGCSSVRWDDGRLNVDHTPGFLKCAPSATPIAGAWDEPGFNDFFIEYQRKNTFVVTAVVDVEDQMEDSPSAEREEA